MAGAGRDGPRDNAGQDWPSAEVEGSRHRRAPAVPDAASRSRSRCPSGCGPRVFELSGSRSCLYRTRRAPARQDRSRAAALPRPLHARPVAACAGAVSAEPRQSRTPIETPRTARLGDGRNEPHPGRCRDGTRRRWPRCWNLMQCCHESDAKPLTLNSMLHFEEIADETTHAPAPRHGRPSRPLGTELPVATVSTSSKAPSIRHRRRSARSVVKSCLGQFFHRLGLPGACCGTASGGLRRGHAALPH